MNPSTDVAGLFAAVFSGEPDSWLSLRPLADALIEVGDARGEALRLRLAKWSADWDWARPLASSPGNRRYYAAIRRSLRAADRRILEWVKRKFPEAHACQEKGCFAAGHECEIDLGGESSAPEYFCGRHAAKHGFCSCCRAFWGGVESFETSGLCDHCYDQLRDDTDGNDDDPDYWERDEFDDYDPE